MTKAQKAMLEHLNAATREYSPIEYNFRSKTRVCEKLVAMGLAFHYPHGGFIISEAGRAVVSKGGKP